MHVAHVSNLAVQTQLLQDGALPPLLALVSLLMRLYGASRFSTAVSHMLTAACGGCHPGRARASSLRGFITVPQQPRCRRCPAHGGRPGSTGDGGAAEPAATDQGGRSSHRPHCRRGLHSFSLMPFFPESVFPVHSPSPSPLPPSSWSFLCFHWLPLPFSLLLFLLFMVSFLSHIQGDT